MTKLRCPAAAVEETLRLLVEGGARKSETLVLWLGRQPHDDLSEVIEVYRPEQEAAFDFFRVPPLSMRKLMRHLSERRLRILAQVHTHPYEAFHSEADDRWALIRHEGALSLVIPYFAASTNLLNFLAQTKIYRLSDKDEWKLQTGLDVGRNLEVV